LFVYIKFTTGFNAENKEPKFYIWRDGKYKQQIFELSNSDFSKHLQLASGKPLNTETPAKMNAYIKSVKENEFIDLTNCVFENNPGLRQVAKLMLNSLWGKFGTRRILTQHQFCSSIDDLKKLFNDDTIKACNVVEISNNIVLAMFEIFELSNSDFSKHRRKWTAIYQHIRTIQQNRV
jgi:hypothetical protein